jgi:NCS1 family nucleobase:cation symporter-1
VFLADLLLRRKDYVESDLFCLHGRYGDVRTIPIAITVVSSVLGWGLVTNSAASWLTWQGYLLSVFGLGGKTGSWAYANLGVLVALAVSFVATLLFSRGEVVREESLA